MSAQNPVFIPGPTNMPEALRRACDLPTIDHRSAAFAEILEPALDGVRRVLKSETAQVFVLPTTGTGGWEAAVANTLSPGDTVLAARHGMFSQRWIELCRRFGLDVRVVEARWGEALPVERYAEILAEDRDHAIKAVLATHNETATGVRSDILPVRRALDEAGHPALLLVDGVSSIASMDFRMDEWGVDVAVTGSQKGFMLPPGLAILGLSERAWRATETARLSRSFLDLRDMAASYAHGSFPYTPPVGLLNGLRLSTRMLLDEGLDAVFARHRRIADGVRAAVEAWGLGFCAEAPGARSDTVTAVRTPEGFDSGRLVAHAARRYDVAFGGGLGEVAGKVFRIGHLGHLTDVMMLAGLGAAEMAMVDLGLPVRPGSGVAAAQGVFRASVAEAAKEAA